jgi:N-acetylneuraminate lyase
MEDTMKARSKFEKLEGLIAAPHTPFDKHGDVNLKEIEKQAALLVRDGVRGAYISGTTGEGISCSVDERKAVMEEWVKQARGRLFLIVHAGALSIRDARELAAHAQKIGADATSVVPASFFKPGSVETLVAYVGAIASCAPRIPFYYYHTTMSGVNLSMPGFLEAADSRIPNLAGIKFNSPDLYEYQNCLSACGGKFDIVWGVDEFLAGAIVLGARAAIGSTYNYAAPLYLKIWKDVENGDLASARAGMAKVCRIVDILVRYGGVAAGKAMMAVHGIDAGDVRLPLRALAAGEKKAIVGGLKDILGL